MAVLFVVLAIVMWGFWGFASKMAVEKLSVAETMAIETVFELPIVIGCIFFYWSQSGYATASMSLLAAKPGWGWAIASGLVGQMAGLFFMLANQRSSASLVVSSTALYPLVTMVFARILIAEQLTATQTIGVFGAVVSLFLMLR